MFAFMKKLREISQNYHQIHLPNKSSEAVNFHFSQQMLALEAQLDARLTGVQEVASLTPCRVGNILSWRFDLEIFSMAILSLHLIQEGQLSVSGERMYTILVNGIED